MKNIAIFGGMLSQGGAERIIGYLSKYHSSYYNVFLFIYHGEKLVYEYGGNIVYYDRHCTEADLLLYKKHYQIDCSISFAERLNILNIRSKGKDAVIISVRSTMSKCRGYGAFPSSNYSKYYRYADAIIACSYGVKEDLKRNFQLDENQIQVVYNFINKKRVKFLSGGNISPQVEDFLNGSPYILNVGRLVPVKQQVQLINQYAYLHEVYNSDVKLLILGSGPQESAIREVVKLRHLERYVFLKKFAENPFPYYAHASIVALSSAFEGFPNVVLESLVLGIPVVATDCMSGPREMLAGWNEYGDTIKGFEVVDRGILVGDDLNKPDCYKFAEALSILLKKQDLKQRMKANIAEYIKNYDNESLLCKWLDIIESVTRRSSKVYWAFEKKMIDSANIIIVYGAGKYGRKVMEDIRKTKKREFVCYAVSEVPEYNGDIDGIPVKQINELTRFKEDAVIVISVFGDEMKNEMAKLAWELGFRHICFPYTTER